MLKVKNTTEKNTASVLTKAMQVAHTFGFTHLDDALSDLKRIKLKAANKVTHVKPREKSLVKTMRTFATHQTHRAKRHILGYSIGDSSESQDSFSLHVTGVKGPIAEATIIAAAHTLLESIGIKESTIHINSFGTYESFSRYVRDLTRALKKIDADLPPQVRADMAVSPVRAYARLSVLDPELAIKCPSSMDYLNDEGRTHLWALLEYLEGAQIPYILDNSVVGGTDYFEHTMFEIRTPDTSNPLAYGGRYTRLAQRAFRKRIDTAGITIDIETSGARVVKPRALPRRSPFYFAQLGANAKRLGLRVLKMLHNAGIPVNHSITDEVLGSQMHTDDALSAPYHIIIGYKEALNDEVIVRNTATNRQIVMPATKLVSYLKKLKV